MWLQCYLLDSLILHFLLDFSVKNVYKFRLGVVVKTPQDAHIFELLVLAVTLYMTATNICGSCYSSLATLPSLESRWEKKQGLGLRAGNASFRSARLSWAYIIVRLIVVFIGIRCLGRRLRRFHIIILHEHNRYLQIHVWVLFKRPYLLTFSIYTFRGCV